MNLFIAQANELTAGPQGGAAGVLHWLRLNWGLVGWIIGLAILALVAWQNRALVRKFFREVLVELRKCSWPWDPTQSGLRKYKELIDSSVVVLVSMVLLGAYTSVVDFFLVKATGLVIHWKL
ncbi:MAG TPA: preprotein translocase subunit SecE [Verrucomicrobiae bacterium]|nr:preprotein translocase subunit SecE [Verrucomicrobiae bacterium]